MIRTIFYIAISFNLLYSNIEVVKINNKSFLEDVFYEFYPKKEWVRLKKEQQERVLKDFIRKKTSSLEATAQGFLNDPSTAIKLKNRFDFLYVNKVYEKLVALPLVSDEYITFGKKHILRDLKISHILIGFKGNSVKNSTLSEKEAYDKASEILVLSKDSASFSNLALNISDDPGVTTNNGVLGWVSWGKMDPEFQQKVFELNKGDFSDPIKTKYGYHVVLVLDDRPSEAINFSSEKLKERVEFSSLGSVKNLLKETADNYDKSTLTENNFNFNDSSVLSLVDILKNHQKKTTYMNNIDIVPILNDYDKKDVIVVFQGKGFGVKWLSNRISKSSPSHRPKITNEKELKLAIKSLVLQFLAIEKGKLFNLEKSYGFKAQYNGIREEVLYDKYTKSILNGAPEPSIEDCEDYYIEHKNSKYIEPEKYSVYNMKVKTQKVADSLYTSIKQGSDFFELAKKYSLLSPRKAGKMIPFDKSKNKDIIDAINNISIGEIAKPFQTRDKKWSIIYYDDLIKEDTLDFEKVTNRIKVVLTKENQKNHKEQSFLNLNTKYNVKVNPDFFIND